MESLTLFDVIKRFLSVWFPAEALSTYEAEVNTVCMLVTAGLVLFIGYQLCLGWWWRKR